MLTTWMPCGAKIPVIALFAGVFFADASWVSTLMYFVGIVLIFLGALLIKQITGHKYRKSFFIMELPEYKAPSMIESHHVHAGESEGLHHQGCHHHPGVQRRRSDNADFQLAAPACGRGNGEHFHPGVHSDSVCRTDDPSGIRRMAAGGSSHHWIYRQGKCCRHTGCSLRHNKLYRYRCSGTGGRSQ